MLKSTPSMGRSLDKQSDNQEIFLGSALTLEKDSRAHSNGQISTDNETEVIKLPLSEKTEQAKSERNGVKSKAPWKSSIEGETNGTVIKESNGNTIHAHGDSPDNKTLEKSDSPVSTPNDSSEISSLSESPSALQDDPKPKTSTAPAAGITSEDEATSTMDTTENSRKCKKRRWDDRGQTGNDDDMPAVHRLEEHDENDKPRSEIQKDLKEIETDFAQLKNQMHRERIQELDKEIASINQGIHPEQISRMEEIDKKRLRRLEITASRKRYQESHCQKQHDEAAYRTHYQCMADIRALRKQILEDLERQKYRLIKEKNKLDDASELMALEQIYLKQVQDQWLSTLSEFKYLQENHGFPAAPILETLKADEIDEDLALMGIVREEEFQVLAPSSSSSSPQMNTISRPNICDSNNNPFLSQEDHDVYSPGDRLYCGQYFKKGDAVLVIDSTSGRYTAKFLSATDSEVVIQRPDGSKTRLQMNLLKEGKYQIHLKDS